MRRSALAVVALVLSAPAHAQLPGPLPVATRFGDFDHNTLALTWQPGFCRAGDGCLPDQPHGALLGLHGLWASRPSALVRRGVTERQWRQAGCDDLAPPTDAAPRLSPELGRRLAAVMPHLHPGLLRHEYDKHVACFGFAAETFFAHALLARDAVAFGPFGLWLRDQTGRVVRHADAIRAFARDLHSARPRVVQFRCDRDRAGRVVLTQVWITLRVDGLARFPAPETLADAPVSEDDCPASFGVPGW